LFARHDTDLAKGVGEGDCCHRAYTADEAHTERGI